MYMYHSLMHDLSFSGHIPCPVHCRPLDRSSISPFISCYFYFMLPHISIRTDTYLMVHMHWTHHFRYSSEVFYPSGLDFTLLYFIYTSHYIFPRSIHLSSSYPCPPSALSTLPSLYLYGTLRYAFHSAVHR